MLCSRDGPVPSWDRALDKGDVGAEGAGWKNTGSIGASRPGSDFEPCFFSLFFFYELGPSENFLSLP